MASSSRRSRAAVDRLRALEVRLEHPHGAEGQRHREDRLAVLEQRELRRAAAHVDEERPLLADRDAPRDRELDEARLLDALDGLELDARLAPRPLDERRPVLGLAHGARRDGAVGVDLRAVHLAAELAQRVARLADRRGREAPGEEDLGPEADGSAHRRQVAPGLGALALGQERAAGPSRACEGADASTTRRRSALEPTSMAAKRGMRRN